MEAGDLHHAAVGFIVFLVHRNIMIQFFGLYSFIRIKKRLIFSYVLSDFEMEHAFDNDIESIVH